VKARTAAVQLLGAVDHNEVSPEIQLLQDIRDLFAERHDGRISSEELVQQLGQMEDRPWPEWRNGQPITKTQLAEALRPFGVRPIKKRFGGESIHGYEIDQFTEVFARYLPEQPERVEQGSLFESEKGRVDALELDPVIPDDALPRLMRLEVQPE
jgi:hypothetical protein